MRAIFVLLAGAVLCSGCSSKPREFRPNLAQPVADSAAFDRTLMQCQVMVRRGVKGGFASVAASGAAGGAAAIGAGALAVSATPATLVGALQAPFNAAAAGTIVAPMVAFGVSRIIRSGREKKYKAGLGRCLTEFGYEPKTWAKQKKLKRAQVKAVLAELNGQAPTAGATPPAAGAGSGTVANTQPASPE